MASAGAVELTEEDGARAVELAREAVRSFVLKGQREHPGSMIEAFYNRTGAMVRLESVVGPGGLRGCAGAYNGTDQLGHAIVEAAIEAASADSCGSEVGPAELETLAVSVCVVRDLATTEDVEADLELGRHGVALIHAGGTTCLYPTVPVENGWTRWEYLERICRKAGLATDAWRENEVTVELFEGAVFREREPAGSIEAL